MRGTLPAALALLLGACTTPAAATPTPPPPLPTRTASRITVVYRDVFPSTPQPPYDVSAELVGLDQARGRAILRVRRGARRTLESIDLATRARVESWEINGSIADPDVEPPSGRPGAPGPRLFEYAEWLSRVAPWTAPPLAGIGHDAIVVGPNGTVGYSSVDDSLYAASSNGGRPMRLSIGLRAAYEPVFGPDGAHVAFRGLGPGCDPEYEHDEVHECVYHLFVTQPGQTPTEVAGVRDPEWYGFDRAGATLLTLSHDHEAIDHACVFRAALASPEAAAPLFCVDDLQDGHRVRPRFILDPSRTTGVVYGRQVEGAPGANDEAPPGSRGRYHWFRLADGVELGAGTLEGPTSAAVLNDDGVLCVDEMDGLDFVDLARGSQVRVPVESGAFTPVGFDRTIWRGPREVLLVRSLQREGTGWAFELVVVDGQPDFRGPRVPGTASR